MGKSTGKFAKYIQRLSKLNIETCKLAGGKAINLARMIQAGFPVPDGFVIMSDTPFSTRKVEGKILRFFDELHVQQVAVRSSSLHEDSKNKSYAGFFDSFLCVERKELISKILRVKYLSGKHNEKDYQIAVVVQPMIRGEISGVCFSVNPVTGDDELLIESVHGLGEQLVSGVVTPDRYHVTRDTFEICKKQINQRGDLKYAMSNRQIRQLSQAAIQLEELLQCPVDIEWSIYESELNFLQCRPITAIKSRKRVTSANKYPYKYVWSTVEPMWMMEMGLKTRARLLSDDDAIRSLWTFQDHFYAKIDKVYEYYVNKQDLQKFRPTLSQIVYLLDEVDEACHRQQLYFTSVRQLNFQQMNREHLLAFFDEAMRFYCRFIGLYSISSSLVTNQLEEKLRQKVSFDDLFVLLQPCKPDVMEKEQADWKNLLHQEYSEEALVDHIWKYPYLALNHYSLEQVISVMYSLYTQMQTEFQSRWSPKAEVNKQAIREKQAQILENQPSLRRNVKLLHQLSLSRMRIKKGWAGIHFLMIPFFEEIAKRSGETIVNIIEGYQVNDIKKLISEGQHLPTKILRKRFIGCLWHAERSKIRSVEGQQAVDLYNQIVGHQPSERLSGIVASPGVAHGLVRVINCNDVNSLEKGRVFFQDGDILVTEMAQPSMIDLISKSAAVITNEGGLLSHVAIVCRELGIPCIVDTESATKYLKDQQVIEIDRYGKIITH